MVDGEKAHKTILEGRGLRLDSIDIMRTVAILFMINDHFVTTLSRDTSHDSITYRVVRSLGTASAPIFTFLVGMNMQLALDMRKIGGTERRETMIWRGSFFLFVGFLVNVMIWSPGSAVTDFMFDCDVLTFIGFAVVIVYTLRRLSPSTIVLIVVAIMLASPPLRSASGYATHWRWDATPGEEEELIYTHEFTLYDMILSIVLNGYFPLLPWLVFPLSGFATAKLFLGGNARLDARGWTLPLIGTILVLLAATSTTALNSTVADLPSPWFYFYPATTTFVVGALGIVIQVFWALHRWVGNKPNKDNVFLTYCRTCSRFSLTIYFVHFAVLHWPLFIAAKLNFNADPWFFFQDVCSALVALALSGVFNTFVYVVIVAWDHRLRSRYSLEWLERKCLHSL